MGIDWENMYGDDANLADSYEDDVFDAMNDNRYTAYDDEEEEEEKEDIQWMQVLYFNGRLAGCVSALLMADKGDDEICRFVSEKFNTDINEIQKIITTERRRLPFLFKESVNNAYYINKALYLEYFVNFLLYQEKSIDEVVGIIMRRFPDENIEKIRSYIAYQFYNNSVNKKDGKSCYDINVRDLTSKLYDYTNVLNKTSSRSEDAFVVKGRLTGFVLGMLYLGFSDDEIRKYSEKAFDFCSGSLSDDILNSARILYGHDAELGMLNGIIDSLHYMNVDNSTITDYIIRNVEVDESLIDMIEDEELDWHLINYVNKRISFINEMNAPLNNNIRLKPCSDPKESKADTKPDFELDFAEVLNDSDLPFDLPF